MRYKDIADVRNRGRREVVSFPECKIVSEPSRRIENLWFYIAKDGGRIRKAHGARMQSRWRATIAHASHPIARLWREWIAKCRARFEKTHPDEKKLPKGYHYRPILATSVGWKSFKKRAHAEGNAKIARAMAR